MTHDQAIALARASTAWWVPWWPVWMTPVAWILGRLVTRACVALGMRPLRKLDPGAHWTERARLAAPARQLALLGLVASATIGASVVMGGALAVVGTSAAWVMGALAAIAGALTERGRLDDALGLPRPARGARIGALGFWLVHLPLLPVMVTVLALESCTDDVFGAACVWLGFGLALALWMRGASFAVLRWWGGSAVVDERASAIVSRAAARFGCPAPEVFVLPARIANAYAYPMSGHLVFTSAACAALDDEALEAVTLHELGHLSEGRAVVAIRAVRLATFYGLAAIPIAHRLVAWGPLVLVGLFLFSAIAGRRFTLNLEKRADELAHAHAEEGAYARALEQLHRVNLLPAVTRTPSTHPHLYDRLLAAGVTPSYPRPLPPPTARAARFAVLLVTIAAVFFARSTGDVESLVLARSEDLVTIAAMERARSVALAVPFDVLVLEQSPTIAAREWLVMDRAEAGDCEGARDALTLGPVSEEVIDWIDAVCR